MSYDTVDKRSEDDSRLWPRVGAREDGCGTCVHAGSNTLRGHTSIGNEVGGGRLVMGRHPPDGDQVRMRHLRGLFISSGVLGRKKGVWTNESLTG